MSQQQDIACQLWSVSEGGNGQYYKCNNRADTLFSNPHSWINMNLMTILAYKK